MRKHRRPAPCPKCGCESVAVVEWWSPEEELPDIYLCCTGCLHEGPHVLDSPNIYPLWNYRKQEVAR